MTNGLHYGAFEVRPYGARYFAVFAPDGALIAVTVYRRGAVEVVQRLTEQQYGRDERSATAVIAGEQHAGR